MAFGKKDYMSWAKVGAIAGVATPYVLSTISKVVSMIPGVSLNLQSISISTTGVNQVINTSLAAKLFGLVSLNISLPTLLMTAIGGALFAILGAFLLSVLPIPGGWVSDKQKRLTSVFVIAGIVSGFILSSSIGLPAIGALIASFINAYILAWILIKIDASMKSNLIPQ